jgi:putative MATE family efflux protein
MLQKRVDEFIKNPKKALWKIAFPLIVVFFVQTMYNVVDTAFVGRLGAEAIAALTFSFPLLFILISIGSGLGIGTNSIIARFLGAKKIKAAENSAIHGLIISIILALIIFIPCFIFLKPLFHIFGANLQVTKLGIEYMSIILIGLFFMLPNFVMNNIFISQGDSKTPMKIQLSALILNIILDPIFIYSLKLGVRGAAIATLCSWFFEIITYSYLIHKKSHLHIKISNFNFSPKIIKNIIFVGFPASLTMLLISVYVGFINRIVAIFGTEYVAGMGIAWKLENAAVMPTVGLSLASLTLVGLFYGAKRYDLIKSTVYYVLKVSMIFISIIGFIFFIIPKILLRIFTTDPIILGIATTYIRIIVFGFPLMELMWTSNRAMQGMGYGLPGLITNIFRVFIIAIPLAYIFVFILGYGFFSVALAMLLGIILSSMISFIWLRIKFKKLMII